MHGQGVVELRPKSTPLFPRQPKVLLLCWGAPASGRAIGNREQEKEADAGAVTVGTASWGSQPLWPPALCCRQVDRPGATSVQRRAVCQACILQSLRGGAGGSGGYHWYPATVLVLQVCPCGLEGSQVRPPGLDWLLVDGSGGCSVWIEGLGLESSKKGWARHLQSSVSQLPVASGIWMEAFKVDPPGLLLVFGVVLTLGYWNHFSAKLFSQAFFSSSPKPWGLYIASFWTRRSGVTVLATRGRLCR